MWISLTECQIHGLNKSFEAASIRTFGRQGIGQVNIFQLVYIYLKLMKTLGEDGGTEIIDEILTLIVNRISACDDWQAEASRH